MARDVLQTIALVDDTDGICASQSPGAGAILINGALASGGVAYIYSSTGSASTRMAQKVVLTSGGNDSGITFTVVGKDADGYALSETVTGGNVGAVSTSGYFSTVTSITASGAVAGTLIAGVQRSDGGVTRTMRVNYRSPCFALGLGLDVTGTITCTVQHTFDDINDSTATKTWFSHATLVSKTTDSDGNYAFPCAGLRLLIVPTGTATAKLTVIGA